MGKKEIILTVPGGKASVKRIQNKQVPDGPIVRTFLLEFRNFTPQPFIINVQGRAPVDLQDSSALDLGDHPFVALLGVESAFKDPAQWQFGIDDRQGNPLSKNFPVPQNLKFGTSGGAAQ